jgi:prolyl 4-hydroxylase
MAEVNSEYLQFLKYDVGPFYQQHRNFIAFQVDRLPGVRIMTVFLYLNDVEEGGGTNFPLLDLTVMPKKGRALIWPSVLDSDPNRKDRRTDHQALPVTKGIKYGANAWVHQRDFKTPNSNNCQ